MSEPLILIIAGFFAGAINAVAGGGSVLTLSALVLLGLPLVVANASGTLALLPGYVLACWRMRRDLAWPQSLSARWVIALVVLGSVTGAVLLTALPASVFSALLPFLLLFASALFLLSGRERGLPVLPAAVGGALLLLCCVYGGYFNGGLGFVLLAVLALLGMTDLQAMNALKNAISLVLTLLAVVIYWRAGVLDVGVALWMGFAAAVGAYLAAALSYRLPTALLRGGVALLGVSLGLFLLLR